MQHRRALVLLLATGLASSITLGQAPAAEAPAKPVAAPAPAAPAPPVADKSLPSGREALERYVEKTGGRAAYEKVSARVVSGFMEMPALGMKAPYTLMQAAPNKYRMTIEIPGAGKSEQGSNGTTAWAMDSIQGPRLVEGEEAAQMGRSMAFNAELEPEKHWKGMETVGIEAVQGRPTYKVMLTPASGTATAHFYDVESGLLVKSLVIAKTPMGDVPAESTIGEYKAFDGIMISTLQVQSLGMVEVRMTIEKMEHPEKVADEVLALPPEIRALVEKKAAAPAAKAEEPVKEGPKGG